MDVGRLRVLRELADRGSVTAVAAEVVGEEHGRTPGRVLTELSALLIQRTGSASGD